jgi:hypothetical protein
MNATKGITMNTDARWEMRDADPVGDPSRLPYEVRDTDGDRRADFLVRGDAERYSRDRNRDAGIAEEVGDAAAEVGQAMRGRMDDITALLAIANGEEISEKGAEVLDLDPDELAESADDHLTALPLAVEATTTFEIVLGTGGPDDRLLIECDRVVAGESVGGPDLFEYEMRRALYRYSWTGSGEVVLSGDDRDAAMDFARRVVPELAE